MNRLIKKAFRPRLLTCALLLVASKGALATCSFMDSRFGPNDSVALDWGTIVVQRDTPVGTVVARLGDSTLGGRNNFLQCNASGFTTQWAVGPGFAPVAYGGQTLYQSGVPGLAFRIVTSGAGSTAGRYGTGPLPRQITNMACNTGTGWWRLCGGTWGGMSLQLVKISPITGSGPMTAGSIVQALVVGDTNVIDYTIGSGVIQTVACSVSNSNISVTMGKAKNTDFGTPGSTSGDADFAIDLNCDASTHINLTLAPGNAGAADAAKGILNIDNSGAGKTASGVGVQVMYNNAPLALNSRIAVATTAADGTYAIPLKARYYQTQPAVTPGIANANATFTLTYQ
ncbi:fimbrial protein [Cedecea sp. FDAARGOS_727]|uniref:fimbrial protein n=1 Tax=Cedecea sp. FDAARGOS_727 TaxID=2545798 RepID=UPI00143E12B8|nr:fimbrial protein [Cedecea sp. FDAARGOS_727]QIX98036.1 type 1 fimbrial protein [Cedecea sp. FDAARGOS_727]